MVHHTRVTRPSPIRARLRSLYSEIPALLARVAVIGALLLVSGCSDAPGRASPDSGLDFVHFNGMTGELFYNEMMGGGVALFDYDKDGDLDIYLTQGRRQGPNPPMADHRDPSRRDEPLIDRLFRNDLGIGADGTPTLQFTDVTQKSGIHSDGYGMGVATGDFDNDGWVEEPPSSTSIVTAGSTCFPETTWSSRSRPTPHARCRAAL